MIAIIVAAVAIFGTIGAVVVARIISTRAQAAKWQPLYTTGAVCQVPADGSVPLAVVDQRLRLAVWALKEQGIWPEGKVNQVVLGLRIIVNPVSSWVDSAGRNVGGQQYFYDVAVDIGLTSLCHELAHVCEFAIDGKVDELHSNWPARGIAMADEKYRGRLV